MNSSEGLIREELEDAFKNFLPLLVRRLSDRLLANSMTEVSNTERKAMEYVNDNHVYFKEQWLARMHVYNIITKCKTMTSLYTECFQQVPIYIPRKFRSNTFENQIYEKDLSIRRMSIEMEVLRICGDTFKSRLEKGDKEVEEMLMSSTADETVNKEIMRFWMEVAEQDEQTTNEKWSRKIQGVLIAYEKDKENMKKIAD